MDLVSVANGRKTMKRLLALPEYWWGRKRRQVEVCRKKEREKPRRGLRPIPLRSMVLRLLPYCLVPVSIGHDSTT